MDDRPNYMTPAGYAALSAEYQQLLGDERPKLVDVISWAAGNGDRSENGDYIYGRKRLREIDRRLGFLARRMKAAKVIDPAAQPDRGLRCRIWYIISMQKNKLKGIELQITELPKKIKSVSECFSLY